MKHLLDYITEALLIEAEDKEGGKKLAALKSKIVDALKKKDNLQDYVNLINGILKGADKKDNASLWYQAIKEIFDGQDNEGEENVKYDAEDANVPVAELFPTQSEIDIVNSAKWVKKENLEKGAIENIFKEKNFGHNFGCPVLVYDNGKKWIIDGHHRWSQVYLLNPEGGLSCMVVKGKADVQEFLKLTQGAIASVMAARKGEGESQVKLPVGEARPENNIFGPKLAGDKLAARVVEMLKSEGTDELIVEKLKEQGVKIDNAEAVGKLVQKNRDIMEDKGQKPEKWAAPRPAMPQSDKAGVKGTKGEPVDQDTEGTALNKLAKGELPSLSK